MTATVTVLDNRSTPCAVGLIRAAGVMAKVSPGQVLEIQTRDRFAPVEIPLWASRSGHENRAVRRAGIWPLRYWVFSVVAGSAAASSPVADPIAADPVAADPTVVGDAHPGS